MQAFIAPTNTIDLPLDWDNAFAPSTQAVASASSIPDALILSLTNLGRVDINYIIDITGDDYESVISALKGAIYQNPEKWDGDIYKGWETADEYLSGNLRNKLRIARKANKLYNGRFSENTFAIRKLMPTAVSASDIYITLGSPWVPTDVIEDFLTHIFRNNGFSKPKVQHDEYTGTWEICNKDQLRYLNHITSTITYGTKRIDAFDIIEKTLNMRTISVYDEVHSYTSRSGKKRVLNKEETTLAIEKQDKLISMFQSWVWADPKRKERLEIIFDSKFGCFRKRVYDGSFLTLPGLSKDVELYPYQKDSVARILFSPNTLLAHDVGSGKTYVMIVAGMELKRMGLSTKNMYVVPNNIVSQWKSFFSLMYPSAKVLCVESKSFTPANRESTLRSIRDNDWDAVIIAYSCFERIPLSKEFLIEELTAERDKLEDSDSIVPKTNEFAEYLMLISKRAEAVRKRAVSLKHDNMLKITTDGRKAALDLRLVDDEASFSYHSKAVKCADNVFSIYMKTNASKGTQLVFCDTSVPKQGFNMYDELKRLLVDKGIHEDKIAFVHDATTETKRAKLFQKVCAGEIRILIGSTFKLGTGVNVQDKLVAVHHLDVPWRPSDMTQREGRILRQGNQNSEVFIYRYITEGSFDAYSWQLLETKQRFINELLEGSLTDRSGDDIEDTALDYAEVRMI